MRMVGYMEEVVIAGLNLVTQKVYVKLAGTLSVCLAHTQIHTYT